MSEQTQGRQMWDYTVGTGGATSPFWLPWLHGVSEIAGAIAAIGGVVLVTIRIKLAWREYRGRGDDSE